MGPEALALKIGQPPHRGRELLELHRRTYRTFWRWSEAVRDHAMLRGSIRTVFGWPIHVTGNVNPRSLQNFPMQANGAEMLRLACSLATEQGVRVCAPIHDALLIEAPLKDLDQAVLDTQAAMEQASRVVLDGFAISSDVELVRYPDRYADPRGAEMWQTVLELLGKIDKEVA